MSITFSTSCISSDHLNERTWWGRRRGRPRRPQKRYGEQPGSSMVRFCISKGGLDGLLPTLWLQVGPPGNDDQWRSPS